MESRSGAAQGVRADAADSLEDDSDFEAFVTPHWDSMLRLARRLVAVDDAEDVVQDALADAWRSRGTFDARRGEPRAWLLAIIANQARRRWAETSKAMVASRVEEGRAADETRTSGLDLDAALSRLSERQHIAVALYYYVGLPVSDCARVMQCSEGTVKSTLSDARARLRALLGEEYR